MGACCSSHQTPSRELSGESTSPSGIVKKEKEGSFSPVVWNQEDTRNPALDVGEVEDSELAEYAALYVPRNSGRESELPPPSHESMTEPSNDGTEANDSSAQEQRSAAAAARSARWAESTARSQAVEELQPSPLLNRFLSRESISDAVDTEGFAKAAAIASERRRTKDDM
jgi:hypothetical protein